MMAKNKMAAILNLTENDEHLRPLTNYRPVAMLPFAGRYRMIDFALSNISEAGIRSVAMFISKSGRSIYDHIRSGGSWYLDSSVRGGIFTFSQQEWKHQHHHEDEYEDFYYNHRLFLERSGSKYVYVGGGNVIANVDIRAMQRHFAKSDADIMAVYNEKSQEEAEREGIYYYLDEDGFVNHRGELDQDLGVNKHRNCLRMFVMRTDLLLDLIERATKNELYLELDDLIGHYTTEYKTRAYEHTGYTSVVETMDDYYSANMDMLDSKKFNSLFNTSLKIMTRSKNGVPTYYAPDSLVKNVISATGNSIYGRVERSLLNRRVTVAKDAVIEDSIILQGTQVGEGAIVKYAIIDKDCVIEPGAQVIGTPDNLTVIGKFQTIKAGD